MTNSDRIMIVPPFDGSMRQELRENGFNPAWVQTADNAVILKAWRYLRTQEN
jgi:hypothetical protein